jgi:hypothetical protein
MYWKISRLAILRCLHFFALYRTIKLLKQLRSFSGQLGKGSVKLGENSDGLQCAQS